MEKVLSICPCLLKGVTAGQMMFTAVKFPLIMMISSGECLLIFVPMEAAKFLFLMEFFGYIRRGILSMDTSASKTSYFYPSCRYKGLEIIFDFNELEDAGQEFFSTIGFNSINFLQSLEGRSVQGSLLTIPPENWQIKATNLSEHLIAQNISIEDIRFYLMELFFLITKESSELKNADIGYLSKGQRAIAAQVESIITTNLAKHYTVEELAGQYGISPSSLKKYFSKLFGMPISMYLHQFRMEESARLIKGDRPLLVRLPKKLVIKIKVNLAVLLKNILVRLHWNTKDFHP